MMKLRAWLRIARAPLAATAAFDATACLLLAYRAADRSAAAVGWDGWALLAATSLLIYAAGMAANDLADRDVDRLKDPARPLPSGALTPGAVSIGIILLAAAAVALGGGPAGSRVAVIVALVMAALYDFVFKRFVVPGAIAMGSVRAANASIGVWPLVIAYPEAWPALLGPLCIGLYAAGVTVLSTTEDAEAPRRLWAARVMAALAFGGAATLAWIVGGEPTLGVGIAFGVCSSTLFGRTPKAGPAKKQVLEMLLGLYWLAAVLAGGGHEGNLESAVIYSFFALVLAWLLAVGSQLWIRSLRRAAAPPPAAPMDAGNA